MSAVEDFWGDLLGYIRTRSLVPVVGPDLCVVKSNGTDPERTLTKLIGQRFVERFDLKTAPVMCSMGEAVEALLREHGRGESTKRLYMAINEIIEDLDPEPGEALRQLAGIDDLRWFVSTTPDRLLVQALNDVRFHGQELTREILFSPDQSTSGQANNSIEADNDDTLVLSLFGRASPWPQYAIHEEDQLEWLHALISGRASLPEWLAASLRLKPLLFIGCEIPDWIGRFLLRMESKERLSSAEKQFFFVYSSDAVEPSLSEFFTTYCLKTQIQQLQMEPSAFVAQLHDRWEQANTRRARDLFAGTSDPESEIAPTLAEGVGASGQKEIFISYMREDAEAARRLSEAISKEPLCGNVWLDEQRLHPGDEWEREILNAIGHTVRLFIPVISANTRQADEGFVFKEWKEAVERSRGIRRRRFIVPVIIDAHYDDPSTYDLPDAFQQVHVGHAPGGVPDAELLATLQAEIRNMRRPGGTA